MKQTIIMAAFALAMLVIFVSAVMARQESTSANAAQQPRLEQVKGVIEKVDEAKKDIVVKQEKDLKTLYGYIPMVGKEMTLSLDNQAKIAEANKELSFTDLKEGMHVSIEYKKEGNNLIAEAINVNMPETVAR